MANLYKFLAALIISTFLIPLATAETTVPIEVNLKKGQVTVTSLVDEVKITSIIVNRGSCNRFKEDIVGYALAVQGISDAYKLPATLKFGTNFVAFYTDSCRFLEISVGTDKGDFTFSTKN